MFRTLEIKDYQIFKKLNNPKVFASEACFASSFVWKDADNLEIDEEISSKYDYAIIRGHNNDGYFFYPPLAKNESNLYDAFLFMLDYCKKQKIPFILTSVTKDFIDSINAITNNILDQYSIKPRRDLSEYIYNPKKLIDFSGHHLASKRNHVNQFNLNYDYEFVPYNTLHKQQFIDLAKLWAEEKNNYFELNSINIALDNLETIDCFADCIVIKDKVIAFAIGTVFNNVGITLFQKADTNYEGSYAIMEKLFNTKHYDNVLYINRQEDMGIDNLRKSKMSYNPLFLLEKYEITKDN